jgi:hypothetical protein
VAVRCTDDARELSEEEWALMWNGRWYAWVQSLRAEQAPRWVAVDVGRADGAA